MRTYALLRSIVEDEHFTDLGAPAQAAVLVAVIRYADHDGRWFIKQSTLSNALGRSERRVRDALTACRSVVTIDARRRPDGTQGANDYSLNAEVMTQADEYVRLWTSSRTKASPGSDENVRPTSPDENVRPTSPDENVRAGTASNDFSNGCEQPPVELEEPNVVRRLLEESGFVTPKVGHAPRAGLSQLGDDDRH
ncbi:MAG: hypothetical protein JWM06_1673 [Actinomycetia bacterium]|nr:hypothetical protein [Actinomycetes bacterium]